MNVADVLMPRLTLDQRVLDEVPRDGAVRESRVAYELRSWASTQEVREILRGLQQLGVLVARGGWWRRA